MSATLFGQPRGLATLFMTEMWERFTFYGMRALLVLFLVSSVSSGGFGLDDKTATAIYGLYNAAVYLAALPGGWIADRLIGAQRAVMAGGIAITIGNILLATSVTPHGFYIGLVVIVLGVGLLKPNVSAIVADLYPEGGARLDAAFTIFYIGINIGGFLGPLVTAEAQVLWGQRAGFASAAFFMAVGVAQFYFTKKHLGTSGAFIAAAAKGIKGTAAQPSSDSRTKQWWQLGGAVIVMLIILGLVSFGVIPVSPVSLAQAVAYVIVTMAVLYFLYYFFIADLTREERRRGVVLAVLFVGCALFFSGFEQAGSSLNLFAERYTDRLVSWAHFVIPTGWFQSLNSFFIFIFAPFFAWLWVVLAKRRLNPSAPAKFALGVMLMGSGFLVMAAAAKIVASGTKVLPYWLIMTYLLHTFGELCLSPVGLSYYTKLAPKRFVGQMMGMWFLATSLGNLLASLIAGDFDANNVAAMPGQYMHIVYFSVGLGAILLIISRPVKKLMGNVE
ncbi:MAG: proton-dependent oligopeptide transporter, family [Gammaproteobacteria bacterium]|nr:proton-dependent oligopeptide transporter, family [Gammaproteobacteria bacterium]